MSSPAARSFAVRKPISATRSKSSAEQAERRGRYAGRAAGLATGAAGSCSCRSPTCIGSRRSFSTRGGKRGDGTIRVGLSGMAACCRSTRRTGQAKRNLGLYDVVYVHVIEGKTVAKPKKRARCARRGTAVRRVGGRAELRVRPTVQGAALVLENKTGRILAMAGSFSYFASQLNRTSQTQRQPGSAMKPLTYLTALQAGLQPNTLVSDDPITLAPIGAQAPASSPANTTAAMREEYYWSPRNADGSIGGMFTMRRGLENSVNVVTAHLLDGGISADPEKSLDQVCATAVAAKIYADCVRYYPFVLGAQPVRMIDLAAVLCRGRQRGRAAEAACHRIRSKPDGQTVFQVSEHAAAFHRRRRPHLVLSAQDHAAGRGGARHRARDRWALALCRRQDRNHRGCGRRLVHRLHQRCHHRRVGRLRQWRRQAPFARHDCDRSACRVADLRADPAGRLGDRALRPRRRSMGRRRRPSAIWSICRSTITAAPGLAQRNGGQYGQYQYAKTAAKALSSTSGSDRMANYLRRNISLWRRVRRATLPAT